MYISWLSLGFQAAIFFGLGDVLATYGSHMATPTDSDCIAKQVCVEPRPSALDMTLPAFAAERRRRVPAIDRYLLQAPALSSKPAARRCCSRSTEGRTDGRTPDRYIDPAPHTMRMAASIRSGPWARFTKYRTIYRKIILSLS